MKNCNSPIHSNYDVIVNIIKENSKVLDLGCGDGTLLERLIKEKNVKGKGVEINQENVIQSLHKELSVIQGDIDEGLADFSDNEMDYVILNQTLQSTQNPDYVISEMLRVGKYAIVSFPNFAYWRIRFYLLFKGKMPKTKMLPFEWYNTPNIHLLTVLDFFEFCTKQEIQIIDSVLIKKGKVIKSRLKSFFIDYFAEEVVFVIKRT